MKASKTTKIRFAKNSVLTSLLQYRHRITQYLIPVPDPALNDVTHNLPVTPVLTNASYLQQNHTINKLFKKNSTQKIKLTLYHSKLSQDGQVTTDNFTKILQS